MHNIIITAECVADMPSDILNNGEVDVIYYDVETEEGVFRDTVEIDSQNLMEYVAGGKKKVYSVVPTANDYKNFFNKNLKEYDEIIHICISGGISVAYSNAQLARAKMGKDGNKVHLIDSKSLSAGQGLVTLQALKYRDQGMNSSEIVENLNKYIKTVSTTFLADNANYLYYNGKVSKGIMDLCNFLNLHPVLSMVDGTLTVRKVYFGAYERAAKKYVKSLIGDASKIDNSMGYLVYAGCSSELLEMVRKEIGSHTDFGVAYESVTSATVSANCGPKTFGVMERG